MTQADVIRRGGYGPPNECWTGLGSISGNRRNYRQVSVSGKMVAVHRLSYVTHIGPLIPGMVIDHICMNGACFNPAHLRQVTNQQNVEYRAIRADNNTGYRGVSKQPNGRYLARVRHKGQLFRIGLFGCPTAAGLAALSTRNQLEFLDEKEVRDGIR